MKIFSIEKIGDVLRPCRAENKKIVHCHGTFDLLHVGAIRHLQAARSQGDILVVSVAPDISVSKASSRPMFSQDVRAEAVASLSCVDFVTVSKVGCSVDVIQQLRPNVFVPWDESALHDAESASLRDAEAAMAHAVGGSFVTLAGQGLRSSALVHHYSPVFPSVANEFLNSFCERFSARQVLDVLAEARALKVLFLGETIIDEYHYSETLGKSGKEPVLAVRYLSEERFAGGILATANQAAAVCDHVGMLTHLGAVDSHEGFIREKLSPNVDAQFIYMPGARTIVKRRFVETYPFQKLFEVYFMDPEVPDGSSRALYTRLKACLPNYDAVVVTDYGHGMFTPEIIELLCSSDRFLAVNTQTNAANQGFNTISKYPRADFVCLSEKELRLEARNRTKDIRLIIAETAEKMSCQRMSITRGRDGCLCFEGGRGFFLIPPFTNRIVDRIGAGDALLAVSSLCAAQGAPMEIVGFIGNAVGAQAVEIVGNRSVVSREGLLKQIDSILNYDHWISTT